MLFDKDGIYFVDKSNKDYDFAIDLVKGNMPVQYNNGSDYMIKKDAGIKIYDLDEALKKGNAFPGLYEQYKNYKPRDFKVSGQRERALLDIQMLEFSIIDLGLYLDMYPNDKDVYKIFKRYVEECKKRKENYSQIYGPLTLDDLTDEYEWSKGVWPWEEGEI